jgi:hypothetical protein
MPLNLLRPLNPLSPLNPVGKVRIWVLGGFLGSVEGEAVVVLR